MVISITKQLYLILFSLLSGIITGVFYDLYRIIRGPKYINKIITFIEDILFWILSGIFIFIFLLITDSAYIGTYIYLNIFIGIYIYFKLISFKFLLYQKKLFNAIGKFIRITINLILYPFELIIYVIMSKNRKNLKK